MMASPATTSAIVLHEGTSADLADVMLVMDSAFGETYGEAWTRSQVAGILPMAGVSLTIARSAADSRCAGFTLVRTVADEAELLLIAVLPGYRRRGIARMLLDAFIDRAHADKMRRVHLEVRHGNSASELYRRLGFQPVGRRRDYYRGADGRRHDAVTFSRDL